MVAPHPGKKREWVRQGTKSVGGVFWSTSGVRTVVTVLVAVARGALWL